MININAILKLKKYIKDNQITIIHAHSSSFFLAGLMKIFNWKLKIIWHDHYGKSEDLEARPYLVLKIVSILFNTIIAVNGKLKNWAITNLLCNNVVFVSNFISDTPNIKNETFLNGKEGKRIICLANLRSQKDHINLLKSFLKIKEEFPDWTLHLIGKDFNDTYSKSVFQFINTNKLKKSVFFYGSCSDINHILSQGNIGVLSSKSEGLPVALLEYGFANLPSVVTNVGDCSSIINNEKNGLLVAPKNPISIYNAIHKLIINPNLSHKLAKQLHKNIVDKYTASSMIYKVLKIYQS